MYNLRKSIQAKTINLPQMLWLFFQIAMLTMLQTMVLVSLLYDANAQEEIFTIKVVTEDGAALSAVDIHGNHGVNDLPGCYTDNNGEYELDLREINSIRPHIVFTHSGYRMEPPEINLDLISCPNRICDVKAIRDGSETVLIHWVVGDMAGNAVANVPVAVTNADMPCVQHTDADGAVYFAGKRQTVTCNDYDEDSNNDYYKAVPLNPEGKQCTFTPTNNLAKFNLCAHGTTNIGSMWASCQNNPVTAPTNDVVYKIKVKDSNTGNAVSGVQFYLNNGANKISSRKTGFDGTWTFKPADHGLGAQDSYHIIPTAPYNSKYSFFPSEMKLSPGVCPRNECLFKAALASQGQGVISLEVLEEGKALTGVDVRSPNISQCPLLIDKVTDSEGKIFFPARIRSTCSNIDDDPKNDRISLPPSLPGCTFNHNSDTPFEVCNSEALTPVNYLAQCGEDSNEPLIISGRVYGPKGLPFPEVNIQNNGASIAESRADGSYSLYVSRNSVNTLRAESYPYVFDPKSLQIHGISNSHTSIDFSVVAQIAGVLPPPTPTPCPALDEYEVSGTVFDGAGKPLPDIFIYNNFEKVLISESPEPQYLKSDEEGNYSLMVEADSNNWITAEFEDPEGVEDPYFDPAGYAIVAIYCHAHEVNFKQTGLDSFILSGKVVDQTGTPIPDATIVVDVDGEDRSTVTDIYGNYIITILERSLYTIEARKTGYIFNRKDGNGYYYEGEATQDKNGLDFVGKLDVPPPTPTPTPGPIMQVESACSDDPAVSLRWRVLNPFSTTQTVNWKIYKTEQSGSLEVPAKGKAYFSSETVVQSSNTAIIHHNDVPVDGQASSFTACPISPPLIKSLCSDDPANELHWSIENRLSRTLPLVWRIEGSGQSGSIELKAKEKIFLTTEREAGVADTLVLFFGSRLLSGRLASFDQCPLPSMDPVCTDDPKTELAWKVENPKGFNVNVTWKVEGTEQEGTLEVPKKGSAVFNTKTVEGSPNVVSLYYNDILSDRRSSNFGQCPLPYLETGCSDNPEQFLVWKVKNPKRTSVEVTWKIEESGETGTLAVPGKGDKVFVSQTVADQPNIARLYLGDLETSMAFASKEQCPMPDIRRTCSQEPSKELRWEVENFRCSAITITWEVVDSGETGTLRIPGKKMTYFSTKRVPDSSNKIQIYVGDVLADKSENMDPQVCTPPLLYSVCSDYPETELRWKVKSVQSVDAVIGWHQLHSNQSGSFHLPKKGTVYFSTKTISGHNKTGLIYPGDAGRGFTNSMFLQCELPMIQSVCSDYPDRELRWKVTNPKSTKVSLGWKIENSNLSGDLEIGPEGTVYFSTDRLPGDDNTIILYYREQEASRADATYTQCALPTLQSVCSDYPDIESVWKVLNPKSKPVTVNWEVDGTLQKGSLQVPAEGKAYFTADRGPEGDNETILYYREGEADRKTPEQVQCPLPTVQPVCTDFPNHELRWAIANPKSHGITVSYKAAGAQELRSVPIKAEKTAYVSTATVQNDDNEIILYYRGSEAARAVSTFPQCELPKLSSLCSNFPNGELRWEIYNPKSTTINVGWLIEGTNLSGSVKIKRRKKAQFTSMTMPNDSNTAILLFKGLEADRLESSFLRCEHAPISVEPVCSDNPMEKLRWKVKNPYNTNVELDWEIAGSMQSGLILVNGKSETIVETDRILNNSNTFNLFQFGDQIQSVSSNFEQCAVECSFQALDIQRSEVTAINNYGAALGYSLEDATRDGLSSEDKLAFRTQSGKFEDLGRLSEELPGSYPFYRTDPVGTNDVGYAVGQSMGKAYIWHTLLGMNQMKIPGNEEDNTVFVSDINYKGMVTGHIYVKKDAAPGEVSIRGFAYNTSTGDLQLFGPLPNHNQIVPAAINEHGQVVGTSKLVDPKSDHPQKIEAFIWDKQNGLRALGTLGGLYSEAYDINNAGKIVGRSTAGELNEWTAFLHDGAGMVDLGKLPGASTSNALGINDLGQIVGTSWGQLSSCKAGPGQFCNQAIFWDLSDSSPIPRIIGPEKSEFTCTHAYNINNNGQVVGRGRFGDLMENDEDLASHHQGYIYNLGTPGNYCFIPETPIPTPTPTPTPAPLPPVQLASVCSDNPDTDLKWSATNPTTEELVVQWDVFGTTQKGTVTIPGAGTAYFNTATVPNSLNTVRIYIDDRMLDTKSSEFLKCPDPDEGKKIEICHIPNGNKDNAHTIRVSKNAWKAHEAHGDTLGACDQSACIGQIFSIKDLQGLSGIAVYEQTTKVFRHFFKTSSKLLAADIMESPSSHDFSSSANEHYDIYISDSKGTLDTANSYITIDDFRPEPSGAAGVGHNIDSASLVFTDGTEVPVDKVTFAELGTRLNEKELENGGYSERALGSSDALSTRLGDKYASITLGFCDGLAQPPVDGDKIDICHTPPGQPDNPQTISIPRQAWPAHRAHGDQLGPCPEPEPTPTPIPTATPTPTPIPMYKLQGSLLGVNGRKLSKSMKRKLQNLAKKGLIKVIARSTTKKRYTTTLESPFDYELQVPYGKYKIWLESSGRLIVSSIPKTFRLTVANSYAGLYFAVRMRRLKQDNNSGKGADSAPAKEIKDGDSKKNPDKKKGNKKKDDKKKDGKKTPDKKKDDKKKDGKKTPDKKKDDKKKDDKKEIKDPGKDKDSDPAQEPTPGDNEDPKLEDPDSGTDPEADQPKPDKEKKKKKKRKKKKKKLKGIKKRK